ncbi:MAG: hypothetical protein EBW54_10855, partial [Betaproteobacteria bacterium]|nr:hypothetical protein [Betaproteobacteria bacterium]
MHDDLLDAVQWTVTNRITTKEKVAIMGGSYGGYAALVGLTFTPTSFACGVDIVGPSNRIASVCEPMVIRVKAIAVPGPRSAMDQQHHRNRIRWSTVTIRIAARGQC